VIKTQLKSRVGFLEIDRHEKRNALDIDHLNQLRAGAAELHESGARALVITGAGSSFSAGADLDGVYGFGFRVALYAALEQIASLPIPVIAAINGPAIGAGTQLALACDLRVASAEAVFAVPTSRNGLVVDPWTVRRLALVAGGGSARALLLGADHFTAEFALARGLADRIGDTQVALKWAEEITSFAPLSLSYSKSALESLLEPGQWDEKLDEDFDQCWKSKDATEGVLARTERRTPLFNGN
jgi:enoyl-CoA hydratase